MIYSKTEIKDVTTQTTRSERQPRSSENKWKQMLECFTNKILVTRNAIGHAPRWKVACFQKISKKHEWLIR